MNPAPSVSGYAVVHQLDLVLVNARRLQVTNRGSSEVALAEQTTGLMKGWLSPPQFLNQGSFTRSARLQASVPREAWTTFNISSLLHLRQHHGFVASQTFSQQRIEQCSGGRVDGLSRTVKSAAGFVY